MAEDQDDQSAKTLEAQLQQSACWWPAFAGHRTAARQNTGAGYSSATDSRDSFKTLDY